jgi:signal transduction histidine kinase
VSLSEFILSNLEPILMEWEGFARTLFAPEQGVSAERLRDHAREMLIVMAKDIQTAQSAVQQQFNSSSTAVQQQDKSEGHRPRVLPVQDTAAETHAVDRVAEGFTLNSLVAEYRALRATVIRLWTAKMQHADRATLEELTRFDEAIDEALSESVERHTARVDRARDLLLGALGHDLRNPLGAVLQSAQYLLQSEALESTYTKAAVRILNSGNRMKELISDLLDFASTRLGAELPTNAMLLDMGLACQAAVDEIGAFHPDRRFNCQLQGDLSGRWDPARIAQLLSNLLGNAVEHGSPDMPVTVTASAAGSGVRVDVHNRGAPIPKAAWRSLFEPLTRGAMAHRDDSSGHRSLGLGLYIASQIAKAHGGKLELSASDQEGTTFTVQLPRNNSPRSPS